MPNGKTKEHEIYHIYNHADEYQVNFERNTEFKILCINDEERPIVDIEDM